MWMNKPSSVCVAAGTNNSTTQCLKDANYIAPERPVEITPYTPPALTEQANQHRAAFRTEASGDFVHLYFRVRRLNYEQLLWQLIHSGSITKDGSYAPESLPFWTIGLRIKVRVQLALGRVMDAVRTRLGVRCPGLRFCLDGFYGMRGFSDVFNNSDACPWMEVSSFSTVLSLQLQDADSIFISIASSAQIQDVLEWRRRRQQKLPGELPPFADPPEEGAHSEVIGSIDYNTEELLQFP